MDKSPLLRGVASIARRLQKTRWPNSWIDPKSIGVGQYQHDVNQSDLARSLDTVVEDCEQCRRGPQHGQRAVGAGRDVTNRGQVGGSWRDANGAFGPGPTCSR
jgi:uncharacterized protein